MLESYVAPLLLSYVSKYIKNIQARDLNLSIWNGDVTLHKLDLRLDVIEQELKMPFKLLSGHINQLDLKIPWMTLGSEPVVVNISTIELVFTLKPAPVNAQSTNPDQPAGSNDHRGPDSKPSYPPVDQSLTSSYTQSFIAKIMNNVSVNISNLILKYIEDDIVFSLNLTSLRLFSADVNWEKAFVDASQSPNFAVRKVCNISDLTMCLDKRNNNGVIESYQDPIMYRCSFSIRTYITFDSMACMRTSSVKVHVFFDSVHISLSDVQLPMFLRLVSLAIEVYYGSLELPNRCVYIESDLSPSDRDSLQRSSSAVTIATDLDIEHNQEISVPEESANQEGWISWAWSRMPTMWSDDDASTRVKRPHLMSIGLFANKLSIMFKPTFSTASRKLPAEPILKLESFGCGLNLELLGLLYFSCDMAATQVTASVLGFCPCGARDSSYQNPFTFMTMGEPLENKVGSNFVSNSLFDESAPENMDMMASPVMDADTYFKVMTEERLRDVFGAFHFSYVFQLTANESDHAEIVYNPSERLLPYHESSWMKVVIYPCNVLVTSSVVHRFNLLLQHASKVSVNYQPYSTPKEIVPTKDTQRLPSNLEWNLLNENISKRHQMIKVVTPNIVISCSNHHHLDSCLPLLYEDLSIDPNLSLLCLQANCETFQISRTTPMYSTRVIGLLSTIPNLEKRLFDQCFSAISVHISKGTLSFCKLGVDPRMPPQQRTFTAPVDISLTCSDLMLQNFWAHSEIDCSAFYQLQYSSLEVYLSKPQFLFLVEFLTSCNCLSNPKFNAQRHLGHTQIPDDIFDNSLPKLYLFASFLDVQSYSKCDFVIAHANLGHVNVGYFGSTDESYYQIFKTESQTMPNSFVEMRASLPKNFQKLNVDNNSLEVSMSSFNAAFVPALKSWLVYDGKQSISAIPAVYSQMFFLFKGEQVFSNYCSASLTVVKYDKPVDSSCLSSLKMAKCLNFQVCTESSQLRCYHSNGSSDSYSLLNVSLPIIKFTSQGFTSNKNMSEASNQTARTSGFPWYLNIPYLEVKSDNETLVLVKTTSFNCAVSNSPKGGGSPMTDYNSNISSVAVTCHFDCENVQVLLSNSRLVKSLQCSNFLLDVMYRTSLKLSNLSETSVSGNGFKESLTSPSIVWRTTGASDLDSEEAIGEGKNGKENGSESHKSEHATPSPQAVKVTLFLQATLTRMDVLIYKSSGASHDERYEKPSIVATVHEISLIADKHSSSLQTKLKIASMNVMNEKEKIFSSVPWFRYDTFCHFADSGETDEDTRSSLRAEEFLRRFRQNNNRPREAFCSVIFTKALSRVILQKLALQTAKRCSDQAAEENYVSEICINLSSFDAVLLSETVSVVLEAFDLSQVGIPETCSQKTTSRGHKQGSVLCVRSLPLINVSLQEMRLCVPVMSNQESNLNMDCLLMQVDSVQVVPHTDRPIQRVILRNSFYTKALMSGDINVPGAPVEDRQYSFTVNNCCVASVFWQDLLLSPDKQKLEVLDVHSQNPALEWNKSEYLQAIIRPLNMAPVLKNVSVRSEFAPAIVITRSTTSKYTELVVVSGHSVQVEITHVSLYVGDAFFKLMRVIFDEFSPQKQQLLSENSAKTNPDSFEILVEDDPVGEVNVSVSDKQTYRISPLKRKLDTITEMKCRNAFVRSNAAIFKLQVSKRGIPVEALMILSGVELNLYQNMDKHTVPLMKATISHTFVSYKSTDNDTIEVSSYGFNVALSKPTKTRLEQAWNMREVFKEKSPSDYDNIVSCFGTGKDNAPFMRLSANGVFSPAIEVSFSCKFPILFELDAKHMDRMEQIVAFLNDACLCFGLLEKSDTEKVEIALSEETNVEKQVRMTISLSEGVRFKVCEQAGNEVLFDLSSFSSSLLMQTQASLFLDVDFSGIVVEIKHSTLSSRRSLIDPFNGYLDVAVIFDESLGPETNLFYCDLKTSAVKVDLSKESVNALRSIAMTLNKVMDVIRTGDSQQCSSIETKDCSRNPKPKEESRGCVVVSEDDIRNGSMVYVSEKPLFRQFPGLSQITFSDESDQETHMTWCYEAPRKLRRVEVAPMPFRTNLGSETSDHKLQIELCAWDVAKQVFVPHVRKWLTEDQLEVILDRDSELDLISPMWRLNVLMNESLLVRPHEKSSKAPSSKLISAVSLAGATRVDSETVPTSKFSFNFALKSAFILAMQSENPCQHSWPTENRRNIMDVLQFEMKSVRCRGKYDDGVFDCELKVMGTSSDICCDGFMQNFLHIPHLLLETSLSLEKKNVEVNLDIDGFNVDLSFPKLRSLKCANLDKMLLEACTFTYLVRNNLTCDLVLHHPNLGNLIIPTNTQMPLALPIECTHVNIALLTPSNFARVQLTKGQTKTVCLLDHRDSRIYSVTLECVESPDLHNCILVDVSNSFAVRNFSNMDLKVVTDLMSPKNKVLVKSFTCEVAGTTRNTSSRKSCVMLPLPHGDEIVISHLSSNDGFSTSVPVLKHGLARKLKLGTRHVVCDIAKDHSITVYPQYDLHNFLPFDLTLLCSNLSSSSDTIAVSVKSRTSKQLIDLDCDAVYEATLLTSTGAPLFSQPAFSFSPAIVKNSAIPLPTETGELDKLIQILTTVDTFEDSNDLSVNMLTQKTPKFNYSATFYVFPKVIVINKSKVALSLSRETSFGVVAVQLKSGSATLVRKDCVIFTLSCFEDESSKLNIEMLQDEVPRGISGKTNVALKLNDSIDFKCVSQTRSVVCFFKLTSEILSGSRIVTVIDQFQCRNDTVYDFKVEFALLSGKDQIVNKETLIKTAERLVIKQKNDSLNFWPSNAESSSAVCKFVRILVEDDEDVSTQVLVNTACETLLLLKGSVLSVNVVKSQARPDTLEITSCVQPGIFCLNSTKSALVIGTCRDCKSLPLECDIMHPTFLQDCSAGKTVIVRSCPYLRVCKEGSDTKESKSWSEHIEISTGRIAIVVPGIGYVYGEVTLRGKHLLMRLSSKPFQFEIVPEEIDSNLCQYTINFTSCLKLASVSFHDCAISEDFPSEVIRLTLEDCQLKAMNVKCKDISGEVEMSLKSLQIDNQLAQSTSQFDFPVILIMSSLKDSHGADDCDSKAFTCFMDVYSNADELKIRRLKVHSEAFECFIEDTFFTTLLHYILQLKQLFFLNQDKESSGFLVPVESLDVDPVSVKLSVRANVKMYISLDQSPLYFNKFKRSYLCSVALKTLTQELVLHYGSGLFLKAGVALGSLDILGNPVRFVSELKVGLKDLLTMPYDGLTRGPTSFITGITGGGLSCVKHISSGALGCMVNLSFSIAKNLDRLSMDSDYSNYQNQLRRHRPVYFSNGVVKGMTGFGIALLGAVSGVVNLPLETMVNADENASGTQIMGHMVRGMSAGLVGVLAKPIGGAADFLAHTGQGLMTTTGLSNEQVPKARPRLQLNLMSNPTAFLLNLLIEMSRSFSPEDAGRYVVKLLVNPSVSIISSKSQVASCLALCDAGLYIWLRHTNLALNTEPSLSFYPFALVKVFEDNNDPSKVYVQLDLTEQLGDTHLMSIDSDCNSSIDLLSRYVDCAIKLSGARPVSTPGSAGHRSDTGSNNEEECETLPKNQQIRKLSSDGETIRQEESGLGNHSSSNSSHSSSATLDNMFSSSASSRILNMYFDVSEKSLFISKFKQLEASVKKTKIAKESLPIVQIM